MQTKNITHLASAGSNQVVASGKAILHRIIIGADVGSAVLEVSDDAADGDANVIVQAQGNALMTAHGVIEVGALFTKGITLDLTNQTLVTVVWEPVA